MSQTDFEQFKQLVFQDAALQNELLALTDREKLFAEVIERGEKHGFQITAEDLEEVWQRHNRLRIERWI